MIHRVAAFVRAAVAVSAVSLCVPLLGWAQERMRMPPSIPENVPYDGRFTFVRVRYDQPSMGGYGGRDVKWAHDYPRGERHFTKILSELSRIRVRTEASNILALDDPELFKYPVAYLTEAGYWLPSDAEVAGLRAYLQKGGFIIFDDFARERDWANFTAQMRRVMPDLHPIRLTPDDRIFDSFYRITALNYNHPYYGLPAEFWGLYETNDRSARMLAMINFNNDMSEYWEYSDEGYFPVEMSNEAYKLGVNYMVYALTR